MRSISYFTCAVMLTLAGCSTPPVVVEHPVIVEKPVSITCVLGTRPMEPVTLKSKYTPDQWALLTTDQREKLLAASSIDRKTYGDNLYVATVGCP